ncbi:MAG: type II toxin-antitoxin system VapC family toxin [Acidobacteria bacterium]|nr:type II toxin-antitoxin system VapC family toxin [Acidobacteriota bacterium]
MIVADVNLVAYLLLGEPEVGRAQQVFEADSTWAAPLLWRSEFRSVLAAYMRQRGLGLVDAWQAHELAEGLLGGHEYTVAGERVLELVASSRCSAYDCEYVALALELDIPLVTSDRQVLRAFSRIAVSPIAFVRGTA